MSNIVKHSQLQEITEHLWGQVKKSTGNGISNITLNGKTLNLTKLDGNTGELELTSMFNEFFKEAAIDNDTKIITLTKHDGTTVEINLTTLLDTKIDRSEVGNSANLIPRLDASGKLETSVLPNLALTEIFVVENEAAMLQAVVQVGDVVIVTNEKNAVYMCKDSSQSTKDNKFIALEVSDGAIKSINNKFADGTGAVTLEIADIPELQTKLDEKVKTINSQTPINGNIDISLENTNASLNVKVGGHVVGSVNYMTAKEVKAIKDALVW